MMPAGAARLQTESFSRSMTDWSTTMSACCPLLKERGLFGIFYICSAPVERRKLLDVHRIHLILGRLGGDAAMQRLQLHLREEMLGDAHRTEFREATYRNQVNDDATTTFKRMLNYWISYEYREAVLDALFEEEFGDQRRDRRGVLSEPGADPRNGRCRDDCGQPRGEPFPL